MLVYFFIAIAATTLGSLTGMGGGVIMKPVLDMIGAYDVSTINLLSAITVFSMSLVSIGQHIFKRTKIDFAVAIPLALGGIAGGTLGKTVFSLVIKQIILVSTMGYSSLVPVWGKIKCLQHVL